MATSTGENKTAEKTRFHDNSAAGNDHPRQTIPAVKWNAPQKWGEFGQTLVAIPDSFLLSNLSQPTNTPPILS